MSEQVIDSAAIDYSDIEAFMGDFIVFTGERAVQALKERAVVGTRGNPMVERTEAVRLAAIKFINGLIDNVPTAKLEEALIGELPVLDPNTSMRVMSSLVGEGAKAAYGRYRFEQQIEAEKARMGITDERGEEARKIAFGDYAGTQNQPIPAQVLIDCTELLHVKLHGLFAAAEREKFGRPSMFNAHLYRGLQVGYVVDPSKPQGANDAFIGCETVSEYIAQRDRMQDLQRELEIKATQERGNAVSFDKYKAS